MLRDAEKSVKPFAPEAKQRVKILQDCLDQARGIDRLLAAERRQQELDRQRAEARSARRGTLRCRVRGPGATPIPPMRWPRPVAAFRELRMSSTMMCFGDRGRWGNPVLGALTRIRGCCRSELRRPPLVPWVHERRRKVLDFSTVSSCRSMRIGR